MPDSDPLRALKPTPSMKATAKYFWVVTALIVVQVMLGGITAHYAVEGQGFYGFQLAEILPYAVTRSWHLQLAIFWIATAWLATGLYIAPAISGHEPKFQRLGVNFLFTCLLVIVVGALGGPVVRRDAEDGPRRQLLVRPPGLRVRGHRPLLAGLPVHRPDPVALPRRPRAVAGAQGRDDGRSITCCCSSRRSRSACSTAPA